MKKYGQRTIKTNDFLQKILTAIYVLWRNIKIVSLSVYGHFFKSFIKPALDMTTAKTPQDVISLSLAEYGRISTSFMKKKDMLGKQANNMVIYCSDTITEDEYETVDAYLVECEKPN